MHDQAPRRIHMLLAASLAGVILAANAYVGVTRAQPVSGQPSVTVATADTTAARQQTGIAPGICADERDAVAAEIGYDGPLLAMSKDALAACEHKARASE